MDKNTQIQNNELIGPQSPSIITETTIKDVEAVSKAANNLFETYTTALSTYSGYIELISIGIAIGIALVAGYILRWFINKRFNELKSSHYWNWVLKPLKLMPALLSLVTLSIAKPILAHHVSNPVFYYPAMQIVFAWFIIQAVHIIIRSKPLAWFFSIVVAALITLQTLGLLQPITQLLGNIGFKVGKSDITILGILHGIVICVVMFWIARASTHSIEKQLKTSRLNYNARELLIKFTKIFIFFTAFIITLTVIGVDMTAFAVFGGALGVGIGLGLQKITANFVSGITLLMEKSIRQGDLIEVDGVSGFVRQMNIRYTLVETAAGQEVSIPNETLTSNNIINSTMTNARGRIEIPVGVAYGSDYNLVKKLLIQAAQEHERTLKDPHVACFMSSFGDFAVNFRLMFWVGNVVDGLLGAQSDVMFRILELFDEHNIIIPYPIQEHFTREIPAVETLQDADKINLDKKSPPSK